MKIRLLSALTAVLMLMFVSACGDDDSADANGSSTTSPPSQTADPDQQAVVIIAEAWARTSPMMASNGAAYMNLTSTVDDRLVGAAVSGIDVDSVEVHEVVMDEDSGEMIMRQVEGIDLTADETLHLEPGGYHVMLLGLAEPLEVGDSFDVILTFENAGEVSASVEVRDSADNGGMEGGMGDGMEDGMEGGMDDGH